MRCAAGGRSTFIINLNKNQVFTQNRFDNLIGYLKTLGVDQVLQKRALAYFNYMTDVECQGEYPLISSPPSSAKAVPAY